MEEFGLADPAYTIHYVFQDYEFILFVSEQQADGSYNAVSNLYGYALVCNVAKEKLDGWNMTSSTGSSPLPSMKISWM
jgi:hypothetical protein